MKKPRAVPTTYDEVFLAIADRLQIPQPLSNVGKGLPANIQTMFLLADIGRYFVEQQPENKSPGRRRGRPQGAKNKLLAYTDNRETLRKRRRREADEARRIMIQLLMGDK
jgi:hypothetical protein